MITLQELIQTRDFSVLTPLAETHVFTTERIHEVVNNEIKFINFWASRYTESDEDSLLTIIGDSVNFVDTLINNPNAHPLTVEEVAVCKYKPLADYARVKLSIMINY